MWSLATEGNNGIVYSKFADGAKFRTYMEIHKSLLPVAVGIVAFSVKVWMAYRLYGVECRTLALVAIADAGGSKM